METEFTLVFVWAIIVTITLGILTIMIVKLKQKHDSDIKSVVEEHGKIQKKTKTLGRSEVRGELNEILGTFKLLNEYEQLAIISSVSKQASLDLLGIKDDSVDFIEIKSLGTKLSPNENKVKKLIEHKQVRYVIVEGNIPKSFEVNERKR